MLLPPLDLELHPWELYGLTRLIPWTLFLPTLHYPVGTYHWLIPTENRGQGILGNAVCRGHSARSQRDGEEEIWRGQWRITSTHVLLSNCYALPYFSIWQNPHYSSMLSSWEIFFMDSQCFPAKESWSLFYSYACICDKEYLPVQERDGHSINLYGLSHYPYNLLR